VEDLDSHTLMYINARMATHYCNTLLQHTTATHYCNTLLQHTTATYEIHKYVLTPYIAGAVTVVSSWGDVTEKGPVTVIGKKKLSECGS